MSIGIATPQRAVISPRAVARIAGVFYALEGAAAILGGVYFRSKFLIPGDPAATATTIQANEILLRICFASALLAVAFHLVYTILFYRLFAPVNRTIALLAAFVSLIACALQAFAALFQLAALLAVQAGDIAHTFTSEQTQTLALLLLTLNAQAFNVYLIFFGFWLLVSGYLIVRSTFFPRLIGVLLMLDGLGWATFLWPPLASTIYPIIALVAAFGELPLLVWLLAVGVHNDRWQQQAHVASAALFV